MNFLAAHKIALLLGVALTGAAIYFLRKRAGGPGAGSAGAPYDNGVPISPYSDSQAPQFSFDFGSLLGAGQPSAPSGSSSQPPNGVPTNPPGSPPPVTTWTPPGREIDVSVERLLLNAPHQLSGGTPPTVSLPIVQPFDTPTPYVPRTGAFVAS